MSRNSRKCFIASVRMPSGTGCPRTYPISRRCAQAATGITGTLRSRARAGTRCAPSRRGRKAVTIYLYTAAHRELRMLTLKQSRSAHPSCPVRKILLHQYVER